MHTEFEVRMYILANVPRCPIVSIVSIVSIVRSMYVP